MTVKTTATRWTITEIKRANKAAGVHWFEPAALRFFASKVLPTVYQGECGVFFVSSEQFRSSRGEDGPRYTVRKFDPLTGKIDTHGPFNELGRTDAIEAARAAARGEEV